MQGETVVYATVSLTCTYFHAHKYGVCYLPLSWLHSESRDFSHGVCCVVNITTAKDNSDTGLHAWNFKRPGVPPPPPGQQ